MIGKLLAGLAALCCLGTRGPQVYAYPDDPRIVMVDCLGSRGSAFRVSDHVYLSVNHVTSGAACTIHNKPIKIVSVDERRDFSIVTIKDIPYGFMPIDCGGFVKGREYIALGYARGLPYITAVELVATGEKLHGFQRLDGVATVIPGQSGGPIIDKLTGRPVGVVNVYNPATGMSGSTQLRDTEVCRNA